MVNKRGNDKGKSEHFDNSAERLYTAVVQENRLFLYPKPTFAFFPIKGRNRKYGTRAS